MKVEELRVLHARRVEDAARALNEARITFNMRTELAFRDVYAKMQTLDKVRSEAADFVEVLHRGSSAYFVLTSWTALSERYTKWREYMERVIKALREPTTSLTLTPLPQISVAFEADYIRGLSLGPETGE